MFLIHNRMPRCCRSADALRQALWPRLDGFDCLSFDVFDTLLRRRVHPPNLVKQAAAAWLARQCAAAGVATSADELFERRQTIERECRAASVAAGRDAEYSLADVLERLSRSVLPGRTCHDNKSAGQSGSASRTY